MLGEPLATLAASGSASLVAAMATDVWHLTRSEVARLFSRGCPARQTMMEAQLNANAEQVIQAEQPDAVRSSLIPVWRVQLEALLHQHPEVEGELRALVTRLSEILPAPQRTWAQANTVRERATSYRAPRATPP